MTRPLVVWGAYLSGGTRRIVVATTTKKAAFTAMVKAGMNNNYAYWSLFSVPTKNAAEIEAAMRYPGTAIEVPI